MRFSSSIYRRYYTFGGIFHMNVYKTENIRNVALLGHGGSGKTTLVESMALTTGIITRMGNINDGNTISDFDKEEIKRKFSISTILVPVEFNGVKINVLDAPGYFDFVGATEEAVSVCARARRGGVHPLCVRLPPLHRRQPVPFHDHGNGQEVKSQAT